MTDKTYNGWASHATWQTVLFLNGDYGDGYDAARYARIVSVARRGAPELRRYVTDSLLPDTSRIPGYKVFGADLLRTDVLNYWADDIDWAELAAHFSHSDDE